MKDSSIYESKNPNNAHNEEYIKSIIRPRIDWAGTTVVLIGRDTSKSEYVNWEIEHAARKGKRIVGVYLPGESDSELPEALNKYGNSLQNGMEKVLFLELMEIIHGMDLVGIGERKE